MCHIEARGVTDQDDTLLGCFQLARARGPSLYPSKQCIKIDRPVPKDEKLYATPIIALGSTIDVIDEAPRSREFDDMASCGVPIVKQGAIIMWMVRATPYFGLPTTEDKLGLDSGRHPSAKLSRVATGTARHGSHIGATTHARLFTTYICDVQLQKSLYQGNKVQNIPPNPTVRGHLRHTTCSARI